MSLNLVGTVIVEIKQSENIQVNKRVETFPGRESSLKFMRSVNPVLHYII